MASCELTLQPASTGPPLAHTWAMATLSWARLTRQLCSPKCCAHAATWPCRRSWGAWPGRLVTSMSRKFSPARPLTWFALLLDWSVGAPSPAGTNPSPATPAPSSSLETSALAPSPLPKQVARATTSAWPSTFKAASLAQKRAAKEGSAPLQLLSSSALNKRCIKAALASIRSLKRSISTTSMPLYMP